MVSYFEERQKRILELLIEEYIRTCRPVSSSLLEKRFNLEISPATIRREFARLTEEGLVERPYISSGRVPTDKGYRFYVDDIQGSSGYWFYRGKKLVQELKEKEEENFYLFGERMAEIISKLSSLLALTKPLGQSFSFKEGWFRVLREPEFGDIEKVREFMSFVQELEKKLEEEILVPKDELEIEIGEEGDFVSSDNFSLILAKFDFDREGLILAVAGPKRMPYKKVLSLIKGCLKGYEEGKRLKNEQERRGN